MRDSAGKITGYVGIGRDITLQQQQQNALKTSEETFYAAMENASIGVVLVDLSGRLLKVNKALCDMLSYDENKLLGITYREITHPDDIEANGADIANIFAGKISSYEAEQRYLHNLAIVVVSAWAEEGCQRLHGDAIGMVDWLTKPLDADRLTNALERVTQDARKHKPRILHVEDDRDLSNVLATVLDGRAELINVPTLQEAKACLLKDKYALVVLDLGLPDGNGLALLGDDPRSRADPVGGRNAVCDQGESRRIDGQIPHVPRRRLSKPFYR